MTEMQMVQKRDVFAWMRLALGPLLSLLFFLFGHPAVHWSTALCMALLITLLMHQAPSIAKRFRGRFGFSEFVALVFAITVLGGVVWYCGGPYLASDDSYIYLGYVKGIARGVPAGLFSYNPGEHSGGTTGLLYYYALLSLYLLILPFAGWFISAPELLLAVTWTLNVVLWVSLFHLVALTLRSVWGNSTRGATVVFLLTFLICVGAAGLRRGGGIEGLSLRFLWGCWSGLEGPLMAVVLMALGAHLIVAAQEKRSWIQIVGDARYLFLVPCLALTRPEWMPVSALLGIPPLLAFAISRDREIGRRIVAALAVSLLVYLPFVWTAHAWHPSALGSRTAVVPSFENLPVHFVNMMLSGWLALPLLACLGAAIAHRWGLCAAQGIVVLAFANRALFGLRDFNLYDRYVSFTLPLSLVGLMCLLGTWSHARLLAERMLGGVVGGKLGTSALGSLLCLGVIGVGRNFALELQPDIQEMNQVVVAPARWISQNVPPQDRLCMEPAGALRLWTENYLVDVVGLTTNHQRNSNGSGMPDLVELEGVDHCFIYPRFLFDWYKYYATRLCWDPNPKRFSAGRICLFDLNDYTGTELGRRSREAETSQSGVEFVNLSIAYYKERLYRPALRMAEKGAALLPNRAAAFNNLGVSYMALRRWEQSLHAFNKALELDPSLEIVRNNIAFVKGEMARASVSR